MNHASPGASSASAAHAAVVFQPPVWHVTDWLTQARLRLPLLWWTGWAALLASIPLLLLAQVDARTFQGISIWIKPWKFHVSVGLHLLTLAVIAAPLAEIAARRPALARLTAVAVASAVFELAYITWRAARVEASHFNIADPFSGFMYALMGLGAILLTGCAGLLGLWVARTPGYPAGAVMQRGLALGLIAGWLLGTLSGAFVSSQTGHWVGGSPTDAQGLAVVGWSRDGGDLRVAHFFGLHAMHVVPLAAWALSRWLAPARALPAVGAFCALYAGLTCAVFLQALQGRPFL